MWVSWTCLKRKVSRNLRKCFLCMRSDNGIRIIRKLDILLIFMWGDLRTLRKFCVLFCWKERRTERPKLESSKQKAQKRKASHDARAKRMKKKRRTWSKHSHTCFNLLKFELFNFKISFQISVNIKINAVILNLSCARTRDSFYTTLYKKYVILSKICKFLEILRRRGEQSCFRLHAP